MPIFAFLKRRGAAGGLAWQLAIAVIALLTGALLLPPAIYFCGVSLLGRYDGGSLSRTYGVVFGGLASGSTASWIVILGPYALWQLFRALRAWWRAAGAAA